MLSVFKQRIVAVMLGLALLSLLIWFVGPYLGFAFGDMVVQPLASELARLVAIVLIVGAWLASALFKRLRVARANRKLTAAVVRPMAVEAARPSPDVTALRDRFDAAVADLRQKRGGRGPYELPWYVIIGAPGSGKTTALVNSGLKFPLEQRTGKNGFRGLGGTRNCDWWFTDDAVFLDTAGRYTTQDSDAGSDAEAWAEFLQLLKKYRGRRPLNGILVTISAQDLLVERAAAREAHVAVIRRRLEELHRELKIQLPIYLLVTKCDLVGGFGEYFDDLTHEARAQVWGATFPYEQARDGGALKALAPDLDALVERLNARVFERLQAESDVTRRIRIFAFPQQMAALCTTLVEFVGDTFTATRFDRPLLLRGVYFTSGTQEGTPIDRLLGAFARRASVPADAVPLSNRGKTYFIQQLLRDVVFAESGLAGVNYRMEMRLAAWQLGAYAAMLVAAVAGVVFLTLSYQRNQDYLASVAQALKRMADAPPPPADAGVDAVLPRLDAVSAVLDAATAPRTTGTLLMRWGLYQGGDVGDAAADAYARELDGLLLSRTAAAIERRLRVDVPEPELLYEYLKAYLMLGDPERLDAEQLRYVGHAEWGSVGDGELVEALDPHFAAVLSGEARLRPLPIDATLVAQARSTIHQANIAKLVYRQLRARYSEQPPTLRLDVASGVGAELVLRRRSGAPLSRPIPALYTAEIFRSLTGRAAADVVETFADDRWVWGEEGRPTPRPSALTAEVIGLYEDDYIAFWDGVLADIDVVPLTTLERTKNALEILARPTSPLRGFLKAVDQQTFLVEPAAAAPGTFGRVKDIVEKGRKMAGAPPAPGTKVTAKFAALHRLVTGEAGSAPIDGVMRRLEELQKKVSELGEGVGKTKPTDAAAVGGVGAAAAALKSEAEYLPPAVGAVVTKIATGTGGAALTGLRGSLGSRYAEDVVQPCREVMGKYPFDPSSRVDVPLQDFARVFGPDGTFDHFFKTEVADLVDTSRRPWAWRRDESGATVGGALPLARFEEAQRIRDMFFRGGSPDPSVSFSLTPIELDASVRRLHLEVHGQALEYGHGPERATSMTWPGTRASGPVVATFDEIAGGRQSLSVPGGWALWRFLDGSRLIPDDGSDVRFLLSFESGGRRARFSLEASSIRNPFGKAVLRQFRCA